MKSAQKFSQRGLGCLLVAVLAAGGLACAHRGEVASVQAPVMGLELVEDPVDAGGGQGPLQGLLGAASDARVQRLRDLARLD